MLPFCRNIRLMCVDKPLLYMYYKKVKIGSEYLGCRVAYCYPSPCIVSPSTIISVEEDVKYKTVELEKNIMVKLFFPKTGGKEVFIYPKHIWKNIQYRFLEPLSMGHAPREAGAILYGPPGTGKTSMARILSWMYGLYTVNIRPHNILSKYVGESEQKLASTLMSAEHYEPSLVLFDDAEWLVKSREMISGGEDTQVYLALLKILLEKFEEWNRRKKLIVNIITTNVSEEKLDQAFRRSGRLGRPIFVPLPDYEAVYNLLLEMGVEPKVAEEYAVKIVNAGLPMSDVVAVGNELLSGLKPGLEPIRGSGYIRLVPPDIPSDSLEYLKKKYSDLCYALNKGTKIWFSMEPSLGIVLVSSIVGLVCKNPVVVLTDQRKFDEAIMTADTNNAVLVVAYEYMAPDVVKTIYLRTSAPTVFVGKEPPQLYLLRITPTYSVNERIPFIKILMNYYGIEASEKELRDLKHMKGSEFEKVVEAMGVYRAPLKYIRKRIGV